MTKNHPAYRYARSAVNGDVNVPKYVRMQCADFIQIASGKNVDYQISNDKLGVIEKLLKIMIVPKGLSAQKTVFETLSGFQWLFIVAVLCVVFREDQNKRRYQTAVMEICRKNGKTFLVAVIFILLFLTEPKFSHFYSVAPDGALSREVKQAIEEIIKSSPALFGKYNGKEKFRILRDKITCNLTSNEYTPLNYSTSRLDGRLPSVFLVDETGALPNSYALEAMRSGQLTILNKLGCVISTKYPTTKNPFEDEVAYCKKILDGVVEDDTVFSLLYEPDNTTDWMTDDSILAHGNPLALDIPEIWEDLLHKRMQAIEQEGRRENFLCKHCNIIYAGQGTESYVSISDLRKCKVDRIQWEGREVYLGVDLSMTNDNTAVSMVAYDQDTEHILADSVAFIPAERIDEKNRTEKIDYRRYIAKEKCVPCGKKTIDYDVVENYVFDVEKKYGVKVLGIGFDRYNCLSSAQKWEKGRDGENGIPCCEVRQHSSVLHPATKWLSECIENRTFEYEENELLEINFENAKCVYDTNLNRYVNKKKSSGKVDMVASLINAVYMLQQNVILSETMDWAIQII